MRPDDETRCFIPGNIEARKPIDDFSVRVVLLSGCSIVRASMHKFGNLFCDSQKQERFFHSSPDENTDPASASGTTLLSCAALPA
jgi:hypothetical protein